MVHTDTHIHYCRPNHELSLEEKQEKRTLKRQLKQQIKLRKLQVRLRQALDRQEHEEQDFSIGVSSIVEQTRVELEQCKQECEDDKMARYEAPLYSYKEEVTARDFIETIYHRLKSRLEQQPQHTTNTSTTLLTEDQPPQKQKRSDQKHTRRLREYRNEQARELCTNMTRGTQTVSMFGNQAALIGYMRQKFIERAVLITHSLGKLVGSNGDNHSNCFSNNAAFLKQLVQVQSICCIGCGPGCDLVGILAFLQSLQCPPPTRAVLLDWAMDQWALLVAPLADLLMPNNIQQVQWTTCDARMSLLHATNQEAMLQLSTTVARDPDKNAVNINQDCEDDTLQLHVDLFVTSYLLSEAREQWHTLFDDLVTTCRSGTLFLFTDPTAWQLQLFLQRYHPTIMVDYVWLDSSMTFPRLQVLEGRVGPAVMICRK